MENILKEIAERVIDVKSIDNSLARVRRDVDIDVNKIYLDHIDEDKKLEYLLETCSTVIDDMDRIRDLVDDLLENLYFLDEAVDYERVRNEAINKKKA